MSVDFPRAWQITREVPAGQHETECSFRVFGMLCDCKILNQHSDMLDSHLQGMDGVIYGEGND